MPWASLGSGRALEIAGFVAIVALAAVLRLVDLPTRGTWDADQGHDMLVLRDLVVNGRIPLLGPPTSIGDFHHGVLYYLLLAPAAAVSGADPIAVTTWIAFGGIAAVAVTGWLARAIAGSVAGLTAALLLAVSASAVEESVFIWNPNLIALSSSIALAAAWHAWQARRPRWWLVAGAAAIATMHCHVLGAVLVPVIGSLLIADARRRRRAGDAAGARAVRGAAIGWLALALLSYVPLAIHELDNAGSELRAAADFLMGGGGTAAIELPARVPIVGLRVLGWPLTGLITTEPLATVLAATLVIALAAWLGWLRPTSQDRPDERLAARWLGLGLVWTVAALAIGAASLATVVAGLPNDHYHAFADPMVVILVGVGVAALARAGTGPRVLPGLAAATIVIGLVGWNLAHQPARVVADGGWPAAEGGARRVIAAANGRRVVLSSLPTFKSDEALRFPLTRVGIELAPAGPLARAGAEATAARVIICDQLFRAAIGADCGGPAEDAWLNDPSSGFGPLPSPGPGIALSITVERFEAAPGRWISIYRP